MIIKTIHDLSEKKEWRKIIETIESLPRIDITFDLRNQLARAYNNISDYEEALKILFSVSQEGKNDAYWNYVAGYAYFHKEDYELALKHFRNSFSLGKKDVNKWIGWCEKYISNNKIELKILANKYKQFGFNISCITNKENSYNTNSRSFFKSPSHSWTSLFRSKQNKFEYEDYDWKNSVGIGTFTNWNNLVVIDIDGCSDIAFLRRILSKLGLPQNYEWVVESGSKNGYHIYYNGWKIDECEEDDVVSTFPPNQEYEKYLDKIEFLWKTHTVLPPSVHGSGNNYSFVNGSFPNKPPIGISTDTIYSFIEEYLDFKKVEVGNEYGEITTLISSKTEFVTDLEDKDISKHFVEDVYLIIDIETSGLPQKTTSETKYPEIMQIAWVLTNKKKVVLKKNSFIIDTPFLAKNDNSEFINIDFETARKVKFPINHVLTELTEDIKLCDYVVAHNIEFDLDILGHYFTKLYGENPFRSKSKICTMKSTINYCAIPNNYGYKYPKLSELYNKLFGYQIKNSHNAEIDVLHTLKCFNKLQNIGVL